MASKKYALLLTVLIICLFIGILTLETIRETETRIANYIPHMISALSISGVILGVFDVISIKQIDTWEERNMAEEAEV